MKRILSLAIAAIILAGCASKQEPTIETQTVAIAVPVPCHTDTKKQRPDLMDLPKLKAALAAAPNVDTKAQIVMSQLLAYMGWLPVTEAAIAGCDEHGP